MSCLENGGSWYAWYFSSSNFDRNAKKSRLRILIKVSRKFSSCPKTREKKRIKKKEEIKFPKYQCFLWTSNIHFREKLTLIWPRNQPSPFTLIIRRWIYYLSKEREKWQRRVIVRFDRSRSLIKWFYSVISPDIPWQEDVECQGWRRARWHRLPFAFSSLLPPE